LFTPLLDVTFVVAQNIPIEK